eukprot:Skav227953  [mRNA]  locus=scaffold146:658090:658951:+ [translate_table: standard]
MEDAHSQTQLDGTEDVASNGQAFHAVVIVSGSHSLNVCPNIHQARGNGQERHGRASFGRQVADAAVGASS